MACAEFEDLLADYAGLSGEERAYVQAHMGACAGCREFFDALCGVDAALEERFAGITVPRDFAQAVHRRVDLEAARPSFIPELLDFAGWAAIMAVVGFALYWLTRAVPISREAARALNANAIWAAAAFVVVSLFVGLRSLTDLKH